MEARPALHNWEEVFTRRNIEECIESVKLRNLISFLISENVILDEEIEKQIERCKPINWNMEDKISKKIKKIRKKLGRKTKREKKVFLTFYCPEEKKGIKISADGKTLFFCSL